MTARALLALIVLAPATASADPADVLEKVRAGDGGALVQALAADLNDQLAAMGMRRDTPVDVTVDLDGAVCHEAERAWEPGDYVIGACFVRVSAFQVAATYVLTVPSEQPVSFAILDLAIE